jgi:ceramide glucosyltransferase
VIVNATLGALALLSLMLMLWQWLVARRFPLHQRLARAPAFSPAVTLLKPLKGCDPATEACLRSWFVQDYAGQVQILLGVAAADDPVCEIVRRLLHEFPSIDAQLVVCGPLLGANLKASKLVELERLAKHEVLVISDADVRVPPDLLTNSIAPLEGPEVGLVNCFYRLANPTTLAMQWEAIAINADFWSQVLQSQSLKPLNFALGAVMATRRQQLREIGGFAGLADCLADDYLLGHRIARGGHRITLSPVVVECWAEPMTWGAVWKHQLRWARTIRVCQPLPYFFSILSNPTFWPLLWLVVNPAKPVVAFSAGCWLLRAWTASDLQRRLTQTRACWYSGWLALVKDLLQIAIWLLAFLGNRIEWRGERMRLRRDGTLVKEGATR